MAKVNDRRGGVAVWLNIGNVTLATLVLCTCIHASARTCRDVGRDISGGGSCSGDVVLDR